MKTILKTISVQKKLQVCSCFMTFVMLFISIHNINYQTDYQINWLSQLLLIGLYFNSEKIVDVGGWSFGELLGQALDRNGNGWVGLYKRTVQQYPNGPIGYEHKTE